MGTFLVWLPVSKIDCCWMRLGPLWPMVRYMQETSIIFPVPARIEADKVPL